MLDKNQTQYATRAPDSKPASMAAAGSTVTGGPLRLCPSRLFPFLNQFDDPSGWWFTGCTGSDRISYRVRRNYRFTAEAPATLHKPSPDIPVPEAKDSGLSESPEVLVSPNIEKSVFSFWPLAVPLPCPVACNDDSIGFPFTLAPLIAILPEELPDYRLCGYAAAGGNCVDCIKAMPSACCVPA